MSVFGENNSFCLPNFLRIQIFWNFDHISKTYNRINYRNIWFVKVIITLIMTAEVLFSIFFFEKDSHLNAVEFNYDQKQCTNLFLFYYIVENQINIDLKPTDTRFNLRELLKSLKTNITNFKLTLVINLWLCWRKLIYFWSIISRYSVNIRNIHVYKNERVCLLR